MLANLQTAAGEATAVHQGAGGYFALFNKGAGKGRQQRMWRMEHLEAVVNSARSQPDIYYSQASFISSRSRRISGVQSVGCSFVDIDCYKLGLEPNERLAQQLVDRAAQLGLPAPSYITASGRGLYLKWLFSDQVQAAQIDRWQHLQSVLIPLYRQLGSDPGVRDPARVLRVVESTNSSANSAVVRPIWGGIKRVDFSSLLEAVSQIDESALADVAGGIERKQVKSVARKAKTLAERMADPLTDEERQHFLARSEQHLGMYAQMHEPIMLARRNLARVNWARFVDLRDLCLMRGGPRRGSRDIWLFWMMNFLGLSGMVSADNFESEVVELTRSFEGAGRDFRPLDDGSLSGLKSRLADRAAGLKVSFKGGDYDPLYTPTNDHLIDLLDITEDEQQRLATIIGADEKRRRADDKVPGRAERRQQRIRWREHAGALAAQQMQEQGRVVVSDIAKAVGMDRSTVSRELSKQANVAAAAALTPQCAAERRRVQAQTKKAASIERNRLRALQAAQAIDLDAERAARKVRAAALRSLAAPQALPAAPAARGEPENRPLCPVIPISKISRPTSDQGSLHLERARFSVSSGGAKEPRGFSSELAVSGCSELMPSLDSLSRKVESKFSEKIAIVACQRAGCEAEGDEGLPDHAAFSGASQPAAGASPPPATWASWASEVLAEAIALPETRPEPSEGQFVSTASLEPHISAPACSATTAFEARKDAYMANIETMEAHRAQAVRTSIAAGLARIEASLAKKWMKKLESDAQGSD